MAARYELPLVARRAHLSEPSRFWPPNLVRSRTGIYRDDAVVLQRGEVPPHIVDLPRTPKSRLTCRGRGAAKSHLAPLMRRGEQGAAAWPAVRAAASRGSAGSPCSC